MKYVDEFRNRAVAEALAERIKTIVRRPWTIMEVTIACCRKTSCWFRGERGPDY